MFEIIVAMTKTAKGIGFKGELPWPRNKADMEHFVKTTTNTENEKEEEKMNVVIMGRKTWDSIPEKNRPLKNRLNVILTKNNTDTYKKIYHSHDNILVSDDLVTALSLIENGGNYGKIFVIGGESIYKEAIVMECCKKIHITIIDKEYECDTFFPDIPRHFKLTESKQSFDNVGDDMGIIFETYENISDKDSDEKQYLNLVDDILKNGTKQIGRNGLTHTTFGSQHVFDLEKGFPLLTTKRMFFDGIVKELLFFIRGQTDSNILVEQGVKIWEANTTREFLDSRGLNHYKEGDMGPMYGFVWRHYGAKYEGCDKNYCGVGYDQLKKLIETLTNDPQSRRHLLTTYDPSAVEYSVLAPCHGLLTQFSVRDNTFIDCKMNQRSVDVALGYPFNIASYALLVHIICHVTGYKAGRLIMTLGDTHIYSEHIEKIKNQLDRVPLIKPSLTITKDFDHKTSTVESKIKFMEELKPEDIIINDYHYWPGIKMVMVA